MGWTTPEWVGKPSKFELFLRERINKALKEEEPFVYSVKGSKGNEYKVTLANEAWSCECVGYTYRKRCTHIQKAQTEHTEAHS